jgi:hypothetical protein
MTLKVLMLLAALFSASCCRRQHRRGAAASYGEGSPARPAAPPNPLRPFPFPGVLRAGLFPLPSAPKTPTPPPFPFALRFNPQPKGIESKSPITPDALSNPLVCYSLREKGKSDFVAAGGGGGLHRLRWPQGCWETAETETVGHRPT